MSVTAKELAKKLGISEAAVSMGLNNKPGVSTRTRKLIIETAKDLGYDFSKIKTAEVTQKDNGIIYFVVFREHGALVPEQPVHVISGHDGNVPDVSFFAQLSEGVASASKRCGFHLNISYLYNEDDIDTFISEFKRFDAKGVLLLGTEIHEHHLKPFIKNNIPFVLIDNYFEGLNADCVLINNVQGAYLATEYLIKKKIGQPGYLRSSYVITGFEERADGFYKAIRRNGMSTSRSIVHQLTPSVEGAYYDMKEIIASGTKLSSCYFADNDLIAAGAMRALIEASYKIPQDISIIGFDDMPLCTYTIPTLTTVHVPKQYMGELAVKRLSEIIDNPSSCPVKIEIATQIKKRKSC